MTIELLITVVGAIFGSTGFWTFVMTRDKKKSAESKLLLGLSNFAIRWICDAHIKQGFCTADDYNDLNKYLFEPYKEAGGDGAAERSMQIVKNLPTRKAVENA